MYMLAEKKAGARRRRRSCMMKAPSSHWLKWPKAAYVTDPFDCRDKYQYEEEGYRLMLKGGGEGELTEAANGQGDEVVGFFSKR
jgi:hypothetical protein